MTGKIIGVASQERWAVDRLINGLRVKTAEVASVANKRGSRGAVKVIKFKNGTKLEVPYQTKANNAKVIAPNGESSTFVSNVEGIRVKAPTNKTREGCGLYLHDSGIVKAENSGYNYTYVDNCHGATPTSRIIADNIVMHNSKNLSVDAHKGASGSLANQKAYPNKNITLGDNIRTLEFWI